MCFYVFYRFLIMYVTNWCGVVAQKISLDSITYEWNNQVSRVINYTYATGWLGVGGVQQAIAG